MHAGIPFHLTDAELIASIGRLAASERGATAELVAHLAVFDARGVHLSLGHPSLFAYCCEVLHLSEHEAYNRIEAARTARRFPEIVGLMRDGALNLTGVRLLAAVLTAENGTRLLAAAAYGNKRDIEELVARERPRDDVADRVRKLPRSRPVSSEPLPVSSAAAVGAGEPTPAARSQPAPPGRPTTMSPLAPDRYEVRFTASAATCEKLRIARDLLRHALPNGETGEIVDRALTLLLEDLTRRKFAAVRRPRVGRGPSPGSRAIGAEVKRAVYLRDSGRCAFLASTGRRCNARAFLEFHHVTPYAVSGEATVDNIQLRCRAHNQHDAKLYFGPVAEGRGQVNETREARIAYA